MSIYVIGIDPGQSGGIVALNNGSVVDISSMPAGPTALVEHFRYLGFPGVVHNNGTTAIFIENVHSMPTDGVHSAFVFGQGLGWLEGVMAAMGLPDPFKVIPAAWMHSFGLKRGEIANTTELAIEPKYNYKKRIKEKALTLVPKIWKDKITLATCDAYLLARYGYERVQDGIKAKELQDGVAERAEEKTKGRRTRAVAIS